MSIVVTGGTGTVGSQVVAALLGRGADVAVLTRDEAKASALPEGVRGVVGDLQDPAAARSAFKGAQAVFLLNALGPCELHEALLALAGARAAGVRRLVYLSVFDVERAPHLPHFASKIAVEGAIKASGVEYTILRANNFYQNDYWYRDAMLRYGVYPQPLGGIGVSRVDVRDIGEAAAIALSEDGHSGVTVNLCGPDPCTGQGTAAAWSRVLDREIAYGGEDMDAWEAQTARFMPPWLAFDLRLMYEYFIAHGLLAGEEDLARQTRLLGHPPRRFEAFAAETASSWRGRPASPESAGRL